MTFTLGKPEGFLQRMLPDRFKADDVDSRLQRWAGRLSPEGRQKIEQTLVEGSFDEQVDEFSETVAELRGKEETRPLYAATVLGLRRLADETDNLLVDLTEATSSSSSYAVDSAHPNYLDMLTQTAVEGLNTYRRTPESNPFEFAADLEAEVHYTLDTSAGILLREHPRLEPHFQWYEIAARTNEGYSPTWVRELKPDAPLARAFHLVLQEQQRIFGDEAAYEVKEMLLDARDFEDNAEVRELGERCWNQLEKNWNLPLLLEDLNAQAIRGEKAAERQVERLTQALDEPGADNLAYLEDGVEVGEQYLPYLFA